MVINNTVRTTIITRTGNKTRAMENQTTANSIMETNIQPKNVEDVV